MVTCRELTELVTDHLERKVPLAAGVCVSLHLSSCQDCQAYRGQMKSLLELLRQLPADPDSGPPRVGDQLLLSFRRRHRVGQVGTAG
jgi:predicted anti-sigma-YlaC factor YlaD